MIGGPSRHLPWPKGNLPPCLSSFHRYSWMLDIGSPAETETHGSLSWSSLSRRHKALPGAQSYKKVRSAWGTENRDAHRHLGDRDGPSAARGGTGGGSGRRGCALGAGHKEATGLPWGEQGAGALLGTSGSASQADVGGAPGIHLWSRELAHARTHWNI